MQWLAQNWPWVVIVVVTGLYLLKRGRHYRLGALGTPGGHGARSGHGHRAAEDRGAHERGHGKSAIDPVSGKPISTDRALTSYHGGRVYYFEDEASRRRFEAAPGDFVKNAQDTELTSSTSRTQRPHRRHGGC